MVVDLGRLIFGIQMPNAPVRSYQCARCVTVTHNRAQNADKRGSEGDRPASTPDDLSRELGHEREQITAVYLGR